MPARAGLAHVATASFLASRVAPTGGYAVALAGGVAVARASQRWGSRTGWGVSAAAMLQTIAIMGPLRFGIPFTQAISAPVLGRMEARGRGTVPQVLVTAAIRAADQAVMAALYIGIILGLEAYTGSYERFFGWLPILPDGDAGAIIATGIALLGWTAFASTVQVLVYRRGLARWPADAPDAPGVAPAAPDAAPAAPAAAPAPPAPDAAPPAPAPRPRFDPRAVSLAGVVASGLLLASTAWVLLAAIAAWLAAAWLVGGGDRSVVRPGLILTAVIAFAALVAGLVGGLDVDETLRRTLRAGLLVLVATWVRYAAREEGLREVFRRVLHRTRRIPAVPEASRLLERLGSTDALVASGRTLIERLRDLDRADPPEHEREPGVRGWVAHQRRRLRDDVGATRRETVAIADAVLDWVSHEAGHFPGATAEPAHPPPDALRVRRRDGVLVALAVATALALPLAA